MRVILILLFALVASTSARAEQAPEAFPKRWFSPASPWNVLIGESPVAAYSEAAVKAFVELGQLNMNVCNIYTPVIIYGDSAKDRTQDVVFKDGFDRSWRLRDVPIPQRLIDYAGYRVGVNDGDGMTCLYDRHKRGFYSFWVPSTDGTRLSVRTGGFSPENGPGWSSVSIHQYIEPFDTPSLGRAAGANYCGGVIRYAEMKAGRIDHALAVQWPNELVRGEKTLRPRVFPATSTDGSGTDERFTVPSGARLQLDPALTDRDLLAMGLNEADLIVAHALQRYGGYVVDTGGKGGAIYFENMMASTGRNLFGVSTYWPKRVSEHLRFVGPPPFFIHDTAAKVGAPVPQ